MTQARFAGKVAVVTGAAHGIGAAIAERLSAEGATVIVADIDSAAATERAAALPSASALALDIAEDASVTRAAAEIAARHGRVDILVNNAAILDMTGFGKLTMDHYRRVMSVNQDGAVRVTLALLPLLLQAGPGGGSSTSARSWDCAASRTRFPIPPRKGRSPTSPARWRPISDAMASP